MNLNATCVAASVPKSDAIHTSAAIWSRCERRRFEPAIRHQRGGRGSVRNNGRGNKAELGQNIRGHALLGPGCVLPILVASQNCGKPPRGWTIRQFFLRTHLCPALDDYLGICYARGRDVLWPS